MRRDFEKKQQELKKIKLDVIGEQFILNSQIDTITDQTARLYETKAEYEAQIKKSMYETDKKHKELQKAKLALEMECRQYESEKQRETHEHFENTM